MTTPMKSNGAFARESFVVASFGRCGHDNFARVLEKHGLLAAYALGTRRGTQGVTEEHSRLNPVFGLLNYMATRCLTNFQAESFRFRLYPLFDRWVRSLMRPGQHLVTSFGFANSAILWAKKHAGKTFIDAENSHPRFFWGLLTEEQKKWGSPHPPVSRYFNLLGLESVQNCDYVFASSQFVQDSFCQQGWDRERVFVYALPVNLEWFKPGAGPRPKSRPLTLLNTGGPCLRKGTPYLLEAYRLILKKEPGAVLRLSQMVRDDVRPILRRYDDLPIDWAPPFNLSVDEQRRAYVERFQTSDIFVFPSLEDGFAIVVAEALACGLPVITTKNTGASDLILPGENGEIVPIRNPDAIAEAVLRWWSNLQAGKPARNLQDTRQLLSYETFDKTIMGHLAGLESSRA